MADIIGYLALVMIVLYVTIPKARHDIVLVIGLAGYLIYGVLICANPIIVGSVAGLMGLAARGMGAARARRSGSRFSARVTAADAPFLLDFIEKHAEDIHLHQPGFRAIVPGDLVFLLMNDKLPAGVVVGRVVGPRYYVHLDYAMPAFRDLRLGEWFYGPGSRLLREQGITEVVSYPESDYHAEYLYAVGFRPEGAALVRQLASSRPLGADLLQRSAPRWSSRRHR